MHIGPQRSQPAVLTKNPIEIIQSRQMLSTKSFHLARYAASDPIKFVEFIRRRAGEYLFTPPQGVAVTRFGEIEYEVDLSIHRIMRKYYFQTHEIFLERIFDNHLAAGQVFIDIGANCGYWSAYALQRVGRTGEIHVFEPVPHYFKIVRRLADLNPAYRIHMNNVAVRSGGGPLPYGCRAAAS